MAYTPPYADPAYGPQTGADNPYSPEYTGEQMPTNPRLEAITRYYRDYLGREPDQAGLDQYFRDPMALSQVEWEIKNSPEGLAYARRPPSTTPPPPPTTTTGGGGGGGGGVQEPTAGLAQFTQSFTQPPMLDLGGRPGLSYIPPVPEYEAPPPFQAPPAFQAPTYQPPPPFSYDPFSAPSIEEMLREPGYQFRLGQGEQALQQSAAARGLLNTGGTLKDILSYGQNFASNEYGNVYNRGLGTWQANLNAALGTYGTNYGTQYRDPYEQAYRGALETYQTGYQGALDTYQMGRQRALDIYQPKANEWETQAQAGQRQNELGYNTAWNQYLQEYQRYRDLLGTQLDVAMA